MGAGRRVQTDGVIDAICKDGIRECVLRMEGDQWQWKRGAGGQTMKDDFVC